MKKSNFSTLKIICLIACAILAAQIVFPSMVSYTVPYILSFFRNDPYPGPHDTLTMSQLSPDGLHLLEVYDNDGAGATVGRSSTVFVKAIGSGERYQGQEIWSICFRYHWTGVTARWHDNETVIITLPGDTEETVYWNIYQEEYFKSSY